MNKFDTWRKPDARKQVQVADTTEETESEEEQVVINPNEWIEQRENKVFRFGGIVTSAEELTTAKGFPFGRYTVEDYTGSYQFTLFGEEYKQYASLLKPNIYVMLHCSIKQKGYYLKYFKPGAIEESEYTFAVQQVSLIQDMHKQLQSISMSVPLEKVQPMFIEELVEFCSSHAGNTPLQLEIYDETRQNLITFSASPIQMAQEFYHWLQMQRMDNTLDFTVQL